MSIEVTNSNFDQIVLKSALPVLVRFWAEWCGPCKVIAPVIEELSDSYQGRAIFVKVNVDECGEISAKYAVRNLPCIILFKNGEAVLTKTGASPKSEYAKIIDSYI
ncbi:thioredoxin [Pseudomonas sp. NPDC088429]|uniref:thioredoxin n=1 Tax=Pseudomonas sp. NPDC088429 TaxID=3364455 RepID=UPI0038111114